jgi:dihydrofolate reductase
MQPDAENHGQYWSSTSPHPSRILGWNNRTSVQQGEQRMRKLMVTTFLTLDGVMQAPGGPGEDDDGGFQYGGWSVPYWDDTMMETMGEATSRPFSMVLGRKTFDIMAAYWPYATEEEGAGVFNSATKYVASRQEIDTSAWQNSVQMEGDASTALAALKQDDGPELQVHGSSDLLQSLLAAEGLIDELRLWIFPVTVGPGKRLFGDGISPAGWTMVDHTVSSTGVIIATYKPVGPVPIGSFDLEDEP